jgi:hypothetical protein
VETDSVKAQNPSGVSTMLVRLRDDEGPSGDTLEARFTVPAKPFRLRRTITARAVLPGWMNKLVGFVLIAKLDG